MVANIGLECDDQECCPRGGRPLADLEATRVGGEMVLLGATVHDSREDLARIPSADPAARRSARRAARRWTERGAAARGPADLHRWRRDSLALWRRVLRGDAGAASDLGRLQAALEDVLVRDAVLLDLVPGQGRIADRVLAGWTGPEVGAALGLIIDPGRGLEPPREQVEAAERVLRLVAGHRPQYAAAALTLLAVLAWWLGDGARAGALASGALDQDSEYRLARLIDEAVSAGLPPGWVRRTSP